MKKNNHNTGKLINKASVRLLPLLLAGCMICMNVSAVCAADDIAAAGETGAAEEAALTAGEDPVLTVLDDDPEPDTDPESDPDPDSGSDQEPAPDAAPDPEPDADPNAGADSDPEPDADPNADTDTDRDPDADPDNDPDSEPDADPEPDPDPDPEPGPARSGFCGKNGEEDDSVIWTITGETTDETGSPAAPFTLTIACTGQRGAMMDLDPESLPWNSFKDGITTVVIGDGIFHIGEYAFCGLTALQTVRIPVSMTSIGENAFAGCDQLTDVRYDGVRTQWDAIRIGNGNEILLDAAFSVSDETLACAMQEFPGAEYFACVYDPALLQLALRRAGNPYLNGMTRQIVFFASNGTFSFNTLDVPSMVVLVMHRETCFVSAPGRKDAFITLYGSIYGGTFDGGCPKTVSVDEAFNDYTQNVIRFQYARGDGLDGIISHAEIRNSGKNGICARNLTAESNDIHDKKVHDCLIEDNYWNGIAVEQGASVTEIRNCTIRNNGHDKDGSAINISHSNVADIIGCDLLDNADKGISTNSDEYASYPNNRGCNITNVKNCVIRGNRKNGVFLKPYCNIEVFSGNIVMNNQDGLALTAVSNKNNTGAVTVKTLTDNTFDGNNNSQLYANGSGAVLNVGNNNIIKNGMNNGVIAQNSGTVKITGSGIEIASNEKAGISATSGGIVNITGKGIRIDANRANGIFANGGKVFLSGAEATVENNTGDGIYVKAQGYVKVSGSTALIRKNTGCGIFLTASGSKAEITGKTAKILSNAKSGIENAGGTLIISGTGALIQGNQMDGIYVRAKGSVSITGATCSVTKNTKTGLNAVGGSVVTVKGKTAKFAGNGSCGIAVNASTVTISGADCRIQTNTGDGIYCRAKGKVTVSGAAPLVTGNKKSGLYALENSVISFTGKTAKFNSNSSCGISANKSTVTVSGSGSQIKSNGANGVYAKDKPCKVTLKNVTVSGNKKSNLYEAGGAVIVRS